MITELTEEQIAKFPEYVDKWVNIGFSTAEIDVDKALAAARKIYEQAGLTFPEEYLVFDSPMDAINEMKTRYDIKVTPNDFVYGSHESSWLSFYDYMYRELSIEECEPLLAHMEFAKHCGWALFYDELVVLTKKPVELKFEAENRIHCQDDYAIKYSDGFGVALWHGLRIPDEWIFNPDMLLDPEILLHWHNVEQRKAACEIVGWGKVLDFLDAKTIDEDDDPEVGKLVEVELPDIGTERFLLALDPNVGKIVGLPVPPDMKTALQANSWTYGVDKVEFKPTFRV